MAEDYTGTKFTTLFTARKTLTYPLIKKLIFWGSKLSLMGLTPSYETGAAGNLSFRTTKGFVITCAGKDLGNLKDDCFAEVLDCDLDKKEISAVGKAEPSSEAMLHHAIYKSRPDVTVIFHVHDDHVIKNCDEYDLNCTLNEQPYGSLALVEEVINVLGQNDYIVMKNHGILSIGKTTEEVGQRIMDVNTRVKEAAEQDESDD